MSASPTVVTSLDSTDPALLAYNPLSKVPTLITDDGMSLYDSPVICEYLDSLGSAPKLFPAPGPARWRMPRTMSELLNILQRSIIS